MSDKILLTETGDSIKAENANWSFGGNVPKNFDEHVKKSVPFYEAGHDLVGKISDYFLSDGSYCYELGCSTAKLTKNLAERHELKKINFVGIDKEKGMITEAKKRCKENKNVKIIYSDLEKIEYQKSDLFISFYTIQFVHPKIRQLIFNDIYNSLNWGGAFILFEKVRANDARFQDIFTTLYTDYKLSQGFTPEEILSKSRSLKGVLEPFSEQGNIDLLKRAGFVDITIIFKYTCFEGFLAIK